MTAHDFTVPAAVLREFRSTYDTRFPLVNPPTSGYLVHNCTQAEYDTYEATLRGTRALINTVTLPGRARGIEVDTVDGIVFLLVPIKAWDFVPVPG